MLALIRRLFRRDPPHLRGRVPVDCGVGRVLVRCVDTLHPDGACPVHGKFCPVVRLRPEDSPPDDVGRAFLRSLPPRNHAFHRDEHISSRTLTHHDGTSYEIRLMMQAGMASPRRPDLMLEIRQDMAQRQRETPQEVERRRAAEANGFYGPLSPEMLALLNRSR